MTMNFDMRIDAELFTYPPLDYHTLPPETHTQIEEAEDDAMRAVLVAERTPANSSSCYSSWQYAERV